MTDSGPERSIESLLDEAEAAAERGDNPSAVEFATEVLRRDPMNTAASRLIDAAGSAAGEMRRLAIMFVDLVGSTSLSTRLEPGSYRRLLRRYHRECELAIADHGGRVSRKSGDGVLALFGHPTSHEDDTARAVRAGLSIIRRIAAVRPDIEREFGETIDVRVAVHLGPVHLDLVDSEIYGLTPNVAARLQDLASPGTVVVSDAVVELVDDLFEIEAHGYRTVKGVDEPIRYHTVVAELPDNVRSRAPAPTPFFSRVKELDLVTQVIDFTDSDPPHSSVVVRGEPGMGKSRLVLEALSRHVDASRRVLWIICSEYERSNDFGAASAILTLDPSVNAFQGPAERLSQLQRDLRSLGLDIDTNVPLLAPLLGIPTEVGYQPAETDMTVLRGQILTALREWLEALATRSRVLVAVDDLQWADDSTLELLAGIVAQPIEGVRFVATERSTSHAIGGPDLLSVDLDPLTMMEATRLAHTIVGHLDDEQLATVLDRGEGNPLFLQELARMGSTPTGDIDPAAINRLSSASGVPRPLYEPLLARLYQPGTDVGLAQAAATIGRNFSLDVLGAVSNRPNDAVERGVATLVDAGLVEPDQQSGSFWFRHVLLRDVAYDLMPDEQRSYVHGRVAEALTAELRQGRRVAWSTIATHHRAAGRAADAAEAYAFAADAARERGALSQGYDHLSAAIELLEGLDDGVGTQLRQADLRLRRAFLSVSQNGNSDPRAIADYEACLELTRTHAMGPEFAQTLVSLFTYYAAKGDLDMADELVDTMKMSGITEDPEMIDETDETRAIVQWFRGEFAAADVNFSTSRVDPTRSHPDRPLTMWQIPQDTVATTDCHYAMSRWQAGDPQGCGEWARKAQSRAERQPFPHGPFTTAYVVSYHTLVLNELARFDRAEIATARIQDIAETHGFAFFLMAAALARAVTQGRRELTASRPDPEVLLDAAEQLGNAVLMQRMVDTLLIAPYTLTNQAQCTLAAGDHDRALALLSEAADVAAQTGSHFYSAETHRIRARALRAAGAAGSEAMAELDQARDLARKQSSVPFEVRALVDLGDAGQDDPRLDVLLRRPGVALSAGLAHLAPPQISVTATDDDFAI